MCRPRVGWTKRSTGPRRWAQRPYRSSRPPPGAWKFWPLKEQHVEAFRQKAQEADVSPTFLHGSYLVNLGGAADLVRKSVDSLVSHMTAASEIGAAGVIFHCGSHKGAGFEAAFGQATAAMSEVLSMSPADVWLIIENSAGAGDHIGSSFQEIGKLMREVDSPQVMVCLDTQHTLAAGYNVIDEEGLSAAMDEFDREIGLSKLVAVHANDSKTGLGSGVDRHENIGGRRPRHSGLRDHHGPSRVRRRSLRARGAGLRRERARQGEPGPAEGDTQQASHINVARSQARYPKKHAPDNCVRL